MAKNSTEFDAVREDAVGKAKNASEKKKPEAASLLRQYKKLFIGAGAALVAVILLLVILNPANSPSSVFNRYLDCLRAENADVFTAISYDANFSTATTPEAAAEQYHRRFSSADVSYKSGGSVNLLNDAEIRVVKQESPKSDKIVSRRSGFAESHRNTTRITDIRDITFEITRGDQVSTGTAEMICVTGKWYIGEVTGI